MQEAIVDSVGLSELLASLLMEQGGHRKAAKIYRYATSPPCV